jgi:hypothetical protein
VADSSSGADHKRAHFASAISFLRVSDVARKKWTEGYWAHRAADAQSLVEKASRLFWNSKMMMPNCFLTCGRDVVLHTYSSDCLAFRLPPVANLKELRMMKKTLAEGKEHTVGTNEKANEIPSFTCSLQSSKTALTLLLHESGMMNLSRRCNDRNCNHRLPLGLLVKILPVSFVKLPSIQTLALLFRHRKISIKSLCM